MCRLPEKLLAILLTLLLGLSPVQGAMAGFAASSDQGGSVHQMSDSHDGGMVMATDHVATQDCEQCNVEATCNCNGHSCSSAQCASCALALLPVFSHPTNLVAAPGLPQADDGFVSHPLSSLFRPPRA